MAKLAILDFNNQEVVILDVSEEQLEKLEDQYDDDTEAWFSGEGLEEKLCVSIDSDNYMWLEDECAVRHIAV